MKYFCPICPVTFLRSEHRTRHQAIHTSQKPHICHHCDRAFTRQDSLRRHFKVHERAIPWNRDSLMDYCRRYIASTRTISPTELFPSAKITSMTIETQKQSSRSKRNQVMSIKNLIS